MDKALDEVISERRRDNRGGRGGRGGGGQDRRRDQGRDGGRDRNRKNERDVANLDDEWIHDKYDEDEEGSRRPARRSRPGRYERASPEADPFGRDRDRGTKIRVENLHWDLNEGDLTGLFERIGPISRLSIEYDRSGRSTGTAYVTYPDPLDARDAVRQFDGANAKGQPINLTIVPSGPNARGSGRNPFDSVQPASRSLFDRIEGGGGRDSSSRSRNPERTRSRSPGRKRAELRATAREDIDRYVPSDRSRSRSRSPRRRGNDRGNDRNGPNRRRGGAAGNAGGGRGGGDGGRRQERRDPRTDDQGHAVVGGRPRMTREELDRDMDAYFGGGRPNGDAETASSSAVGATGNAGGVAEDDIDMIE